MRVVGIASAVFVSIGLVQAQPLPPAAPPAAPAADPVLDGHLEKWHQTIGKGTNFSTKFELTRTESVFKKERKYVGSALFMKPNLARISHGNVDPARKSDFEAYICNGKSLFEYNYDKKTIIEYPLAQGQGDNLMMDLLGGMTPAAAKKRFIISQFNPADKNYVYFDIKPTLPKDKQEFEQIRFALYGPNVGPPHKPYMPAKMYMVKPSGDSEMWSFTDQAVDVAGVAEKHFQYEQPANAKEWKYEKAPPMSNAGPPAPPAGGLVRPQK